MRRGQTVESGALREFAEVVEVAAVVAFVKIVSSWTSMLRVAKAMHSHVHWGGARVCLWVHPKQRRQGWYIRWGRTFSCRAFLPTCPLFSPSLLSLSYSLLYFSLSFSLSLFLSIFSITEMVHVALLNSK